MELSNRVIRHFSQFRDSFLRVTFTDEGWQKMTSFALNPPYRSGPRDVGRSDQKTEVYDRILTIVTKVRPSLSTAFLSGGYMAVPRNDCLYLVIVEVSKVDRGAQRGRWSRYAVYGYHTVWYYSRGW